MWQKDKHGCVRVQGSGQVRLAHTQAYRRLSVMLALPGAEVGRSARCATSAVFLVQKLLRQAGRSVMTWHTCTPTSWSSSWSLSKQEAKLQAGESVGGYTDAADRGEESS
eukprot:5420825-Karenia_brevis.AAC.1